MPKKERQKTLQGERLESLTDRLLNLIMHTYVGGNPLHDRPEWKAVPTFGVTAWKEIVAEMLKAGWKPPVAWEPAQEKPA
jgi:hypothetical protein